MKFPKVAIITTTFNQDEKVEKCLRYLLKKTDYPKYKIYFLDDSGTGEIAKKVKKLFKKVDVSSNNSNLGYAISNNILMKRAIKEFSPGRAPPGGHRQHLRLRNHVRRGSPPGNAGRPPVFSGLGAGAQGNATHPGQSHPPRGHHGEQLPGQLWADRLVST